MMALSDATIEKIILDKWYHAKKHKESTNGLFSRGNSIL